MSFFYRISRLALKAYFHLFYRFSVYGTENLCTGKAILAANHASFLDPPVVSVACPEELHFLARASLYENTILNFLLKRLHTHPVRGTAQDIDSIRMICNLLQQGEKVVVFPEGERSASGEMQSMKSGIAMLAFRMQSPIIPIYITGTFEAWPRQRKWPKLGGSIDCIFGKPIYPSQFMELPKKQAQEMMIKQVQESVEQLRLSLEHMKKKQVL